MRYQLTENQLELLDVLWERGEATVQDVHEVLARQRDVAPATVATMLNRLCSDGVIARTRQGRQFYYRALVAKEELRRSMLGRMVDRLFGGDGAALVSQLVRERQLTVEDLEHARSLLEAAPTNAPPAKSRATKRRGRARKGKR